MRHSSKKKVTIDPSIMEIDYIYKPRRVSPIRSKQSGYKNRDCSENDFNQCIDKTIGVYGKPVIIGNGTFGILLRAKTLKNSDVVIKFIFNINKKSSRNRFINIEKELSYSYYMGAIGVGPKVLDSFYYNIDFGELRNYPILQRVIDMIVLHFNKKGLIYPQFYPIENALNKNIDPSSLPLEIQCIVMKAYDNDCEGALLNQKISIEAKTSIIKQMVDLIEKQIRNGLFCYDIKPDNFVVNINHNHIDVKMIDFGADFCTEKKIYEKFQNDGIINSLGGINFVQLLYISNVIQIFALFVKTNYMDNISPKNARKLLFSFFNHRLFQIFFSNNWESFIDRYIDYAYNNYINGKSDPANNLVWYSSPELKTMAIIYSKDNLEHIKHFLKYNLTKVLKSLK